MASTYTNIGTELMTTGENAGNWGTKTNTNLQIIEEAIAGYATQALTSGGTVTLTYTDGTVGDVARHAVIALTGSLSGNAVVEVPSNEKIWIIDNQSTNAYTVTVRVNGQSGVTWGTSDKGTKILYANGTDVVDTNIGGGVGGYDLNGEELILDADANTSITADTDNQIDIKIAGADDFQFTANTFTAQAGSTIAAQALTATTITASGIIKTDATTEATSTTDGSLQTDGGLSVAKDTVLGDDLKLLSDSAVLSFGADSDTTLTHTDGTGLTLNSTNKLLFRDTGLYINSSTDGQLDLVADTEIQIAATTIDINGAIAMDGAITGATNITLSGELDAATLDISGDADIDGTTNLDAVDIDGAVQIDGAVTVGVDGTGLDVKLFGDTAGSFLLWDQSDDALELTDSSPIKIGDGGDMQIYHDGSNSYITNSAGALKVATETSGIAITLGHSTSEVTVADNLTITGDLTVNGTTTTVNSTTVTIDDPIFTLGGDSAPGSDDNKDRGIEFRYHDGSNAQIGFMGYDDSATGFTFLTAATNSSEVFSGTAAKITAGELDISGNMDIDGTSNLDAVDIDGAVQLDATLTIGANDQGYDVILYGDTASANVTWDTSADDLIFNGAARIVVPDSGLVLGSTAVTTTAAEINLIDGGASTGTTAVADADGILTNDGGTMRLTTAATFKTYFQSGVTASGVAADDISAGDAAVTLGNGSTSADVTIDSGDDVVIDAAGGNVEFKDAGTLQLSLDMDGTAGVQIIKLGVDSDDLVFQQFDGNEVMRINDNRKLCFFDDGGEHISSDGTDFTFASGNDINLTATTDINVPSGVGMTFGNDGEKIEGDGTDLTIAGNNINLTAVADVVIPANVGITFGSGEKIEGDSTDLTITSGGAVNLTATTDVVIPANVGITFGSGEKIEGDSTDLTITSGAKINLTATSDVVIPANVGITFGTGEKIEGDSTDLTVTSGAKINLTATSDVHLPNSVGMVFGDAGEKIEGDGTDLTISSSALANIDAGTDIVLDADGGDIFFKDDGTTFGSATNTSGNLIIKSGTTTAATFSGANVTFAGTINGGGTLTTGGNVVIPDAGNIGSASDTDSIAIASNGVVTFSQAPVFPDGSLALADLDIDGGTDVGAALVDADLIIVDDGAGGTNRKATLSRLMTYVNANSTGIGMGKAIAAALVFG